jgi:hypothetical protein
MYKGKGVKVVCSPLLTYARSIQAFGPGVQKEEVTSQATPLAEDFLKVLQGQLSSDAFGTGVGPLQRESGTALRQFISALQGGQGGQSEGLTKLIGGLEARTERSVGDLREQSGILGQRFGSSLAQGEGVLRSEADAQIGALQEQGRQFDTTALFQAIQGLFGQGEANIDPFRQFASLGIMPEEIIVSPSTATQVVAGVTGLVDAAIPG